MLTNYQLIQLGIRIEISNDGKFVYDCIVDTNRGKGN